MSGDDKLKRALDVDTTRVSVMRFFSDFCMINTLFVVIYQNPIPIIYFSSFNLVKKMNRNIVFWCYHDTISAQ